MPNGFGVRAGMPNFGSVIVRAPRVESVVGCVLLVGNLQPLIAISFPLPLVHRVNFSPICELRKDLTMIDHDCLMILDSNPRFRIVSHGCLPP